MDSPEEKSLSAKYQDITSCFNKIITATHTQNKEQLIKTAITHYFENPGIIPSGFMKRSSGDFSEMSTVFLLQAQLLAIIHKDDYSLSENNMNQLFKSLIHYVFPKNYNFISTKEGLSLEEIICFAIEYKEQSFIHSFLHLVQFYNLNELIPDWLNNLKFKIVKPIILLLDSEPSNKIIQLLGEYKQWDTTIPLKNLDRLVDQFLQYYNAMSRIYQTPIVSKVSEFHKLFSERELELLASFQEIIRFLQQNHLLDTRKFAQFPLQFSTVMDNQENLTNCLKNIDGISKIEFSTYFTHLYNHYYCIKQFMLELYSQINNPKTPWKKSYSFSLFSNEMPKTMEAIYQTICPVIMNYSNRNLIQSYWKVRELLKEAVDNPDTNRDKSVNVFYVQQDQLCQQHQFPQFLGRFAQNSVPKESVNNHSIMEQFDNKAIVKWKTLLSSDPQSAMELLDQWIKQHSQTGNNIPASFFAEIFKSDRKLIIEKFRSLTRDVRKDLQIIKNLLNPQNPVGAIMLDTSNRTKLELVKEMNLILLLESIIELKIFQPACMDVIDKAKGRADLINILNTINENEEDKSKIDQIWDKLLYPNTIEGKYFWEAEADMSPILPYKILDSFQNQEKLLKHLGRIFNRNAKPSDSLFKVFNDPINELLSGGQYKLNLKSRYDVIVSSKTSETRTTLLL